MSGRCLEGNGIAAVVILTHKFWSTAISPTSVGIGPVNRLEVKNLRRDGRCEAQW